MISPEEVAERVAYAKEVSAIAEELLKNKLITPEAKEAMVTKAALTGREVTVTPSVAPVTTAAPTPTGYFSTMQLPSGKPLTYDMIRDFADEFVVARSSEKIFKIAYGPKIVGGLKRISSLRCITAYNVCKVIQPSKAVKAAVIKRCQDIKQEIKKVEATDPAAVIIPEDMAVDPVELRIMERSDEANKKVYVLGGRKAWVAALIKYGGYEGYKTAEELKSEKTQLFAMGETAGNYYRELEPFMQYIESNNVDLRSFGPAELKNYGIMYRADDFLAKQKRYADKVAFYESNQKAYKRDLGLKMARYAMTMEEAIAKLPAKPTMLAWNSVVGHLNTISNFFATGLGINFPPNPDGVATNPLKGVHIPEEETEAVPYRLAISEKKELRVESDEIIQIYRDILNAPLREQYKRGIFIILRLIRETGARPSNVVWLRWRDFPTTKPRQVDWKYARGKKVEGKGAPQISYISAHLAEDIDAYRHDYKPDKNEHVAGEGIFNRHDLDTDADSGFAILDKRILGTQIVRLSKFTGDIPVHSKKFRKSYASLVWACLKDVTLVEELTGDQAKTIKAHYVDTDWRYIDLPESIRGKFTPAEIVRKVFDQEYPTTGIPDKYVKSIER